MTNPEIIHIKKNILGYFVEARDGNYLAVSVGKFNSLREQDKKLRMDLQKTQADTQEYIYKYRSIQSDLINQKKINEETIRDNEINKESLQVAKDFNKKQQTELQKLKAQLATAEEELEKEKALNETLLRMCRERANADRCIKPKKGRSGYLFIKTGNKNVKVNTFGTLQFKETVLQTPYDITLGENQALQLVLKDFGVQVQGDNKKIGEFRGAAEPLQEDLIQLGFEEIFWGYSYKAIIEIRDTHITNCVCSVHVRIPSKSDYWDVIIIHTKPVNSIPPDLRAK